MGRAAGCLDGEGGGMYIGKGRSLSDATVPRSLTKNAADVPAMSPRATRPCRVVVCSRDSPVSAAFV